MTVRVNKPAFNIREKLSKLERPIGVKGHELMGAETAQEARDLVSAGRKNLIINGDMRISQRGVDAPGTGYNSVDRIHVATSTADTRSSQGSLTSGKVYDKGFRNFVRMTNTTGSTASNCYREIDYKMESRDLGEFWFNINNSGSYATLSAWIRSSVTQKFFVYIRSIGGTTKSYTFGFEAIANTWVKIEHTIPGDPTLGVNNDNSLGMVIRFVVDYGPDYTGSSTEEVWRVTGSDYTPDSSGTWAATAGATFDITGLQLEVGKNATDFEYRPYGEELALCQRYFYKLGGTGSKSIGFAYTPATSEIAVTTHHPVPMRIEPGVSLRGDNHQSITPNKFRFRYEGNNNFVLPSSGVGINVTQMTTEGGSFWFNGMSHGLTKTGEIRTNESNSGETLHCL